MKNLCRKVRLLQMGSCSFVSSVCVAIVVLQIVRRILPWLYKNLIGPKFFGPKIDVRQLGEWAVVTGATDGIGKSYAKALAAKGLKVVLISRSSDKLQLVANEIESESGVEVKIIVADFTKGGEIYDKIAEGLEGLSVAVLVNNVGMSYEYPEFYMSIPRQGALVHDLIECNIKSVTQMCKIVLPNMIERKKGVIINISSLSAMIPSPLLTIYAASKAFVDKFSTDLNAEYKSKGIIVQSVLPGFVATNMTKLKRTSYMAPSSDEYVANALRTLGISTRTTGYFGHCLMKLSMDAVKTIACGPLADNLVLKQMVNIKNRALRKKD